MSRSPLRIVFALFLCASVLPSATSLHASESDYAEIIAKLRDDLEAEHAPLVSKPAVMPSVASASAEEPPAALPRSGAVEELLRRAIERGRLSEKRPMPAATPSAVSPSPARRVAAPITDHGARPMPLLCAFDGRSFQGHFSLLRHLQTHRDARQATVDLHRSVDAVATAATVPVPAAKGVKTVKKTDWKAPVTETERAAARILEGGDGDEEKDLPIQ